MSFQKAKLTDSFIMIAISNSSNLQLNGRILQVVYYKNKEVKTSKCQQEEHKKHKIRLIGKVNNYETSINNKKKSENNFYL
jgi:hypothetical protein